MKILFLSLLFSTQIQANDLCNKGVTFNGDCEMAITVFEFDAKEGKCIERQGSGCSSDNGFQTEAECMEVCKSDKSLFERISNKTQEKLGN